MARIRYIKPEYFDDEVVGGLSLLARYLYIGLFCQLDRSGVLLYSSRLLKAKLFPFDEQLKVSEVESAVDELVDAQRVFIFRHEGNEYLYCPSFRKHQLFHKSERTKYTFTAEFLQDQCKHRTSTGRAPVEHRYSTGIAPVQHPKELVTGNGERVIGNGELVTGKVQKSTAPDKHETLSVSRVRNAFQASYRKEFGRDYPGWGKKENGQASQWLKSISVDKAIELCMVYPRWNDPWVTKLGHPFGVLVTQYVQLDAWAKSSKHLIQKIAQGKAAESVDLKRAIDLEEMKRGLQARHQRAFGDEDAEPTRQVQGPISLGAPQRVSAIGRDSYGSEIPDMGIKAHARASGDDP